MRLIGIGIDITTRSRIQKLINKVTLSRFAKKILNDSEDQSLKHTINAWCIKESVYKALPNRIDFKDIIILKDGKKPVVLVDGFQCLISLSHEGDTIVSVAIVYKND